MGSLGALGWVWGKWDFRAFRGVLSEAGISAVSRTTLAVLIDYGGREWARVAFYVGLSRWGVFVRGWVIGGHGWLYPGQGKTGIREIWVFRGDLGDPACRTGSCSGGHGIVSPRG
jgi:hypothetical protein